MAYVRHIVGRRMSFGERSSVEECSDHGLAFCNEYRHSPDEAEGKPCMKSVSMTSKSTSGVDPKSVTINIRPRRLGNTSGEI